MRTTVCLTASVLICLATLVSLVDQRTLSAADGGAGRGVAPAAAGRLNVLFLMTDEHHYRALSLAGCPYIQTPNLDRIGREGAWFTNATCVTPYCSPSRASLITGLYPHKHRILTNVGGRGGEQAVLPQDTFPNTETLLHRQGYATHQRGKWHLGEVGDFDCYE